MELFFHDVFLILNLSAPGSFAGIISMAGGELRVRALLDGADGGPEAVHSIHAPGTSHPHFHLGAQFQLGKLLAQSLGMPARSFKLCTASRCCFCCLYLGGLPLLAIFREGLTGGAKLPAGFLEPLDLAAQSFLAC